MLHFGHSSNQNTLSSAYSSGILVHSSLYLLSCEGVQIPFLIVKCQIMCISCLCLNYEVQLLCIVSQLWSLLCNFVVNEKQFHTFKHLTANYRCWIHVKYNLSDKLECTTYLVIWRRGRCFLKGCSKMPLSEPKYIYIYINPNPLSKYKREREACKTSRQKQSFWCGIH